MMMQARGGARPGEMTPAMQFDSVADVPLRYGAALHRALPQIPQEELRWRFERANNLLMANQGRSMSMSMPMSAGPGTQGTERTRQDERAWLLIFLAGALAAPATRGADTHERISRFLDERGNTADTSFAIHEQS